MENLPKLDQRLSVIASLVRDGVRCADIGTDHGYLIAWLAATGRICSGFACDINEKPLEKAAFTLSAYGLTNQVRLLRCNGLAGLHCEEIDDIVIAGMGGDLIWKIIDAEDWTRNEHLHFLLQPMTKQEHLRQNLYKNGFEITQEIAVVSGDFPYTIMDVHYTGIQQEIDLLFAYTGKLLNNDSEAARKYLSKTAYLIRQKVEGLKKASKLINQLEQFQNLLKILEGVA